MFNYYVFNPSYENAATDVLEDNLQTLQTLFSDRNDNEEFLKHDSLWDIVVADGTFAEVIFSKFQDKQFSIQVLPHLLQQITSVEEPINTIDEFNNRYRIYNAFYGINFQDIPAASCIADLASYKAFIRNNYWELTPQTFGRDEKTFF
jgi:hypothetical protein